MENIIICVGYMEINYGDVYFCCMDNGNVMYNLFVGNYIVDVFNIEIGGEVYYQKEGWIVMLGIIGGEINGNIIVLNISEVDENFKCVFFIIGKIGYDSEVVDNVCFWIIGFVYYIVSFVVNYFYSGDCGGFCYYFVMFFLGVCVGDSGIFFFGCYSFGFMDEVIVFMGNVFVKVGGFEFFGIYEMFSGCNWFEFEKCNMMQVVVDVLYCFGKNEDFYIGGCYNIVNVDVFSDVFVIINCY